MSYAVFPVWSLILASISLSKSIISIYFLPDFAAKWIGAPLLVTKFKLMFGSSRSFSIVSVDLMSIANWIGSHPSLVHLFTSTSRLRSYSRILSAPQNIA